MCFVICLGLTAQVQQREIISAFLESLPRQYFSLVAHPITLIMGCLEGQQERESGLMSAASAAWPPPLARQNFLKESWRSPAHSRAWWGEGQTGTASWEGLLWKSGCQEGPTAFPVSSNLTLLNGTAVPKSLCQPGEGLVAAVQCYF